MPHRWRAKGIQASLVQIHTQRLTRLVIRLAGEIGARNIYHYEALRTAADHIKVLSAEIGYTPVRQTYEARSRTFDNVIEEFLGSAARAEVIVVGAHYDTHRESPGADDNGSAIAALLELARAAIGWKPQRTSLNRI
jgi:Zn-dependent M28 family amino/carboxypeptidase